MLGMSMYSFNSPDGIPTLFLGPLLLSSQGYICFSAPPMWGPVREASIINIIALFILSTILTFNSPDVFAKIIEQKGLNPDGPSYS